MKPQWKSKHPEFKQIWSCRNQTTEGTFKVPGDQTGRNQSATVQSTSVGLYRILLQLLLLLQLFYGSVGNLNYTICNLFYVLNIFKGCAIVQACARDEISVSKCCWLLILYMSEGGCSLPFHWCWTRSHLSLWCTTSARPMVTFPAVGHHCPWLVPNILLGWWKARMFASNLPKVVIRHQISWKTNEWPRSRVQHFNCFTTRSHVYVKAEWKLTMLWVREISWPAQAAARYYGRWQSKCTA